jgi:hypothetical protein
VIEIAVHVAGGFLLFAAVGALCLGGPEDARTRKLGAIGHGIGLLLILLTGLALVMRGHIGFPAWVWIKIVIWVLMSVTLVVIRRSPGLRVPLFFLLPILGGIAAWLAIARPIF